MEPNWDEMLTNQNTATKQAEEQVAKAQEQTERLKKILGHDNQHHHYDNDHHHHQEVHHTGETDAKHDCCIIM